MLSYATIFIACLIVAVVALVLYKVISDSSRSVYSSKDRIAIINRNPASQKDRVKHNADTKSKRSIDRRYRFKQLYMTRTVPAMPVNTTNSACKGSRNNVQDQDEGYRIVHA